MSIFLEKDGKDRTKRKIRWHITSRFHSLTTSTAYCKIHVRKSSKILQTDRYPLATGLSKSYKTVSYEITKISIGKPIDRIQGSQEKSFTFDERSNLTGKIVSTKKYSSQYDF